MSFDTHRPPDPALLDDCVHCGFCLPTCPTYVLWHEEMDSPRGRIHLMRTVSEGAPLSDSVVQHLDACLGCMACVTSCPSGVQYDRLIEQTRAQIERNHQRRARERALREAIFALFPYPRRLRALRGPLRWSQRLGLDRLAANSTLLERLSPSLAILPQLTPQLRESARLPQIVPAIGQRRARIAMLTGCVQEAFFGQVNAATARVLAAEGCEVLIPPAQSCCGALSSHSGREAEAAGFARSLIETLQRDDVDAIIVNSAGCGSAMKEYDQLLAEDPAWAHRARDFRDKVRDLSEFLVELGPVAQRNPLPLNVAYHDACHLGHAQGVRRQPRALLSAIPDVQVHEINDAAICCGSAGVYNILHPQPAAELGDAKAANVAATGADLLVTANPGCLMQIGVGLRRRGTPMPSAHLATVLDASIRGLAPAALTQVSP